MYLLVCLIVSSLQGLSHINQRKARDYEKLLKGEIQAWAQEPAMQKYCDQVLGKHRSQFLAALQKVWRS